MKTAFIPAEWAPQQAMIIGFPSHPDLWPGHLLVDAQCEVAALCNILAEAQTCYVLVANQAAQLAAKRLLSHQAIIMMFNFGDIWFRDIAPIFKNARQALRFRHNGWGKKYCYRYDNCAAERLAAYFNLDAQAFDFVLEGGALEHNGDGAILTSRQCLLNKNRNAWSQACAEKHLTHAFNSTRIYWLDQGLAFDHTDGHIDNIARFIKADTVVCQDANGQDNPNTALYQKHQYDLLAQGLEVVTLPSPGLIKDAAGNIMPASHLNFIISNECVIFPHYLKNHLADKKYVDATEEILRDLFPDRDVMCLASNALLTGGGSFHCISQQIPR
ncbi:MAG: agmatine deiminase family protein [Cellvibrionaceae bacterium]|nr:agmatine deiminase family protein [Cellvibrionaceae bacterium]